jgi:hypothetical protein
VLLHAAWVPWLHTRTLLAMGLAALCSTFVQDVCCDTAAVS